MAASIKIFSAAFDDSWAKAHKKAADPHMTLNNNPLRGRTSGEEAVVGRNMERLHRDADAWDDPHTGHIYRAIRGMTLDKGE